MTRSDHDQTRAQMGAMVDEFLTGRLSRRQLLTRAAALGISVPALGAILAARPQFASAQATPSSSPEALQLGDYSGKTLNLSLALAEEEFTVFQDVALKGFQDATGGKVEPIKIEAADAVKTLQAQVPSGNVKIDLIMQDNNTLGLLVADQLVEEIPNANEIVPATTIPALTTAFVFNGTNYFLPARPNVQITYYNETALKNDGVSDVPKTWDDLMAAGKAIKDKEGVGKLSIQGVPGGAVGVTCTQFIWQAGGDPLQIDSDEAAQAFKYMQDLKPYLTPQYPTATFDTTNTYILNQSVVLAQNWPFGVNVIVQQGGKKDVLTYEGWSGPAGNFLVLGGDVFGIVKGTKNKDMALDFAKFFMSQSVQQTFTEKLGWPPIRTDAFAAVADWQKPYFETIRAALGHTKARPTVTYWADVENILSDAFNDIVTNGKDPKSTLADYQKKIDDAKAKAPAGAATPAS
ncbi:MAG TPA: extracellular solute-binding protein [Thermomicrobiales bacterium]|nr:extracellular solute-binding protein [Thermomicrobiales bacterium]